MRYAILSVFLVGCLNGSGTAPLDAEDDAGLMRRMMAGVGDAGASDSGKGDAGADVSPDAVIVPVDGPAVSPDASIVSPDAAVVPPDVMPDRFPDVLAPDAGQPAGSLCANDSQCASKACVACPGQCVVGVNVPSTVSLRRCPTIGTTAVACSWCGSDVSRTCSAECWNNRTCLAAYCAAAPTTVNCCR